MAETNRDRMQRRKRTEPWLQWQGTARWRDTRQRVFERDRFTCQCGCGVVERDTALLFSAPRCEAVRGGTPSSPTCHLLSADAFDQASRVARSAVSGASRATQTSVECRAFDAGIIHFYFSTVHLDPRGGANKFGGVRDRTGGQATRSFSEVWGIFFCGPRMLHRWA